MAKKIIIIGSGAAGMTAASSARAADAAADITVFTEDRDVAYSPCMIPWVLGGRATWQSMIMHTPDWYAADRNIKVLTETTVEAVDGDQKTVTAKGQTYPYDSLVLATGGKVFIPPIEGTKLPGVFTVRTVKGGQEMEEALKTAQKVVIGGAGVIGLELAVELRGIGKEVTVIEMMDQVIPRIADRDMAEPMQKYLETKGVRFVMKAPIQAVLGKDRVEGVTAAGQNYPCDLIIFATGVRANTDLAKTLGYDIGQLGAIAVSPTLQPYKRGRLVPDVYVAGDVMQCTSAVYPGPTMSQLGSSAVKEGLVAGRNAAGQKCQFGAVASPWVSVIGDLQIAGTGMSLGLASWYGIAACTGKATGCTRARYYPDGKELTVKVIADRDTHRLIGAQLIAGEDATGRIDWLTAAIISGITAEEFLVRAENAYCPPTSQVRDVVIAAVEDLAHQLAL